MVSSRYRHNQRSVAGWSKISPALALSRMELIQINVRLPMRVQVAVICPANKASVGKT
jgi:hypothetical protein